MPKLFTTNVIGIDPGKQGGIAVLDSEGTLIAFRSMPERPLDLFNFLRDYQGSHVFMERIASSPQMGVVGCFNFGVGKGHLEMACIALAMPATSVDPRRWQRHFNLLIKGLKMEDKGRVALKKKRNRLFAQRLLPTVKITNSNADAILIATYGRARLLGEAK